jgi:hypothetical protein
MTIIRNTAQRPDAGTACSGKQLSDPRYRIRNRADLFMEAEWQYRE